jgi:hypothetical protein
MTATAHFSSAQAASSEAFSAPVPIVTKTLLYPIFRIARLPLSTWARELQDGLTRCLRETRTSGRFHWGVAETGNQTALLVTYRGDTDRARLLCERQMVWAQRAGRRARDPGLSWHMVNPWSNLGRLDALAGDWRRALDRFAALRRYSPGLPLCLGSCVLRVPGGRTFQRTEDDFSSLLHLTTVLDICKTLLWSRQFDELDELATELRSQRQPKFECIVDEARMVAGALRREFDVALAIVDSALQRGHSDWTRVVFQLRRAELIACCGGLARASAELHALARKLLSLSLASHSSPPVLQILVRVATFASELGDEQLAERMASAAHLAAQTCRDQTFEIESLRTLIAVSPIGRREQHRADLAQLEQSTEYVRYRRSDRPLERSAIVDGLANALVDAFER